MSENPQHLYEFGPFHLDTAERQLLREGEPVQLTPKVFETLCLLVERGGHLVGKDELIKRLWPDDKFVEEANLTNNVWMLRKTLGERQDGQSYIETVPKRGYRFTAPVRELQLPGIDAELILEKHSRTHIVTKEEADNGNYVEAAPEGDANRVKQIASDAGWIQEIAWAPDGRIVYRSNAGGSAEIWVMNADGSNPKQLTADARASRGLAVSPDGRYIFFASDRAGRFNIWRVDADGSNLKQLTAGDDEFHPHATPDGAWVVYQRGVMEPRLWKVAVDGGESVQLTETRAMRPAVSPDGSLVAYHYLPRRGQVALENRRRFVRRRVALEAVRLSADVDVEVRTLVARPAINRLRQQHRRPLRHLAPAARREPAEATDRLQGRTNHSLRLVARRTLTRLRPRRRNE